MNWFSRILPRMFGKRFSEKDLARGVFGVGPTSASGQVVTAGSAMRLAAVYSCVRVISETVSSLPCNVYRRLKSGGAEVASDHPAQSLIHSTPNPFLTSMAVWEMVVACAALTGNGYATVQREPRNGNATALWPWHPDNVNLRVNGSAYKYEVQTKNSGTIFVSPGDMVHLKALTFDGYSGISPIGYMIDVVGSGLSQQEYGSTFYRNAARPSGVIEMPGAFSNPEQREAFKRDFRGVHQGSANTGSVPVLEHGMKWNSISISPEEAQFLETRKFSRSEIASIFRVPPHLIGDLERATFSNVEQQSIDFVVHTIRPWLVRLESELNRALFFESERSEYYVKFKVDALLRGDTLSRAQAEKTWLDTGVMTIDEVRALEEMNPHAGGIGAVARVPLNMVDLGKQEVPVK